MKQDISLIMRYLDGDLRDDEKNKVEYLLQTIEAQRDLLLIKQIEKFLSDADLVRFRNCLSEVREEYSRRKTIVPKIHSKIWYYAASLLVILGITGYFLLFKEKQSNNLFAQYYKPYPADATVRSGNSVSELQEALKLYDQGLFHKAFEPLQAISDTSPYEITARFYLGICAIETNRFAEAIQCFENVASYSGNPYQMHARWYLSLCYLHQRDTLKAMKLLEGVRSEPGMYRSTSNSLYDQLKP